jgi:adenylyltransferase/sulfurtransferase
MDVNPFVQIDTYETTSGPTTPWSFSKLTTSISMELTTFRRAISQNDASVLLGKPNVYGLIFRFEGQARCSSHAVAGHAIAVCTRPTPKRAGAIMRRGGVLGILPGIVGLIQAAEAGQADSRRRRIINRSPVALYRSLQMRFRELKLRVIPAARCVARNRSFGN